MLNPSGGVLDDLIAYYRSGESFRLVVNAGTRRRDVDWLRGHAEAYAVAVVERTDLAMLAVQGPRAREAAQRALGGALSERAAGLRRFEAAWDDGERFVARTGYTGEDGYEVMLPAREAVDLWRRLAREGVRPVGLGARDTLRLEAGLNLYGADMDEGTSPLESGLGWTVAWTPANRAFVGREALEAERARGVSRKLAGLVLEGRGVLRSGQRVFAGAAGGGAITSGGFGPTLGKSIGLARLPVVASGVAEVEIRGRRLPARVVSPPFVRHGKALV
jgi:aminomethyltransferase